MNLTRYFPIFHWLSSYRLSTFRQDLMAAFVVTIMLVPQSLAYALLAGVPAQVGLYASIIPLILYAIFGSSHALSVGPVAVISLMTATISSSIVAATGSDYLTVVILLALMSGIMLVLMGLLQLGFLANFLSHSVMVGFITASALIIALSQFKLIFGLNFSGNTLPQLLQGFFTHLSELHLATTLIGLVSLALLYLVRSLLPRWLTQKQVNKNLTGTVRRFAPVVIIVLTTGIVWLFELDQQGVAVIGTIPTGLPTFSFPVFTSINWQPLLLGALLISLIGFIESVSVGQTFAMKKYERIDPNQELLGLGMANIGAALSGGMPVTGGFSRSVVNQDAGAQTPAAGIFTGVGLLVVILWLTPWLSYLPLATLAATIVAAVLPLIDYHSLQYTWRYDKADFAVMLFTILFTLFQSIESGIIAGVVLSMALHFYRTSKPHIAILGLIEGSEHFRNIKRYQTITHPEIVMLRIDENLYFPNVCFWQNYINRVMTENPQMKHLVLVCSAINYIDASALESLHSLNYQLRNSGIQLHLAEIKGPVYERLAKIGFIHTISGKIFVSAYNAWHQLTQSKELDGRHPHKM